MPCCQKVARVDVEVGFDIACDAVVVAGAGVRIWVEVGVELGRGRRAGVGGGRGGCSDGDIESIIHGQRTIGRGDLDGDGSSRCGRATECTCGSIETQPAGLELCLSY